VVHVLCFFVLLFLAQAASACGCSKPRQASDVQHYAHIFKGEVLSVAETRADGYLQQTVAFRVRKHIAGKRAKVVTVSFGGNTSCDLEAPHFVAGETYLISDHDVYLSREDAAGAVPSGLYFANFCSLREPVHAAPQRGVRPPKTLTISEP
jgi:hypothetical protein